MDNHKDLYQLLLHPALEMHSSNAPNHISLIGHVYGFLKLSKSGFGMLEINTNSFVSRNF